VLVFFNRKFINFEYFKDPRFKYEEGFAENLGFMKRALHSITGKPKTDYLEI
jgi:hypothetical protein